MIWKPEVRPKIIDRQIALVFYPSRFRFHVFEKLPGDEIGVDSFGFRAEIRDYAMSEDGGREGPDVLDGRGVPPANQGAGFRSEHEELGRAWPGAPTDPFLYKIRRGNADL